MKHFVGISLFLLALPMVAAEAPMSYVRVIEPDPLALSFPSLSPYAYCANNPVNKALGEVEPGEPTRTNHFGTPIIVGSPNSTEPISSPEIIYKRKTK